MGWSGNWAMVVQSQRFPAYTGPFVSQCGLDWAVTEAGRVRSQSSSTVTLAWFCPRASRFKAT